MGRKPFVAAAVSVPDNKGNREANFSAAAELASTFAGRGAQLIVLPESCLQGYPMGDRQFPVQRVRELAEPFDGPYAVRFRQLAAELKIYLVVGYDEQAANGVYNTAELIGPDGGSIGVYRKTHIKSGRDADLYSPGDALPVFETPIGNFGILICHDRAYAEAWRTLALRGAEAILIPSCGSYGDANTCRLRTYAGDHGLFSVFAHPKNALIISASGKILSEAGDQEPGAMSDVDLASGSERRRSWHGCRRADLYSLG